MNEIKEIQIDGKMVLTTSILADLYGTTSKVISNNFNNNKNRYKVGKHYICLEGEELKDFLQSYEIGMQNQSKIRTLYLWTEKGAFLHAKSLGTDKAWEVYENLVDFYFNKKKPMSTAEQIQILAQGNIELEQKIDSVDKDLQEFKREMPLLAIECQQITEAKNKKVVPLLGGKDSNAYKNASLRGRVYRDLEGQLRREFGVSSYKAIHRNQTDKALEIISEYELPLCLAEQIRDENAQLQIGV